MDTPFGADHYSWMVKCFVTDFTRILWSGAIAPRETCASRLWSLLDLVAQQQDASADSWVYVWQAYIQYIYTYSICISILYVVRLRLWFYLGVSVSLRILTNICKPLISRPTQLAGLKFGWIPDKMERFQLWLTPSTFSQWAFDIAYGYLLQKIPLKWQRVSMI